MNLLVITCDQLSAFATSIAGSGGARTPAMARLAARGVCFDTTYCTSPVCVPSRVSYMTGLLPHQSGIYENAQHDDPKRRYPAERPTLGTVLSAAGYRCVHYGKDHAAGALRGFDCHVPPPDPVPAGLVPPGYTAAAHDPPAVRGCAAFLRERQAQPFLAFVDLDDPHDICGWLWDAADRQVPVPESTPWPALRPNAGRPDTDPRPLPVRRHFVEHVLSGVAEPWTEQDYSRYLAAYYGYVERADANVAALLEALEGGPNAADTCVVFFADHGESLGAHGHVSKGTTFYEETTRVPLVIAGPGVGGELPRRDASLVSLADVVPTLCELAGVEPPADLWGKSLLPRLRGDASPLPHRDLLVVEWREHPHNCQTGRMLRTACHKYTHYLRDGGEELFDLRADPFERSNLAHDPCHQGELERHRTLLRSHVEQTGDDYFSLRADPALGLRLHWQGGRRVPA
jgi:choline-sulfatase